jgi:hypothetical protein
MHLGEDKLETLRRWGQGLREAGGEERAASGRAILMLIEEIERLRLELSRTREQGSREDPAGGEAAADTDGPPASTLHQRVQQAVRRDSAGTGSGAGERATTSPEAWIESLRRPD